MPFSKSQNITKPSDSKLKFLLLGNPVRCHNDKIYLVRTGRVFFRFFQFLEHSAILAQALETPVIDKKEQGPMSAVTVTNRRTKKITTLHLLFLTILSLNKTKVT